MATHNITISSVNPVQLLTSANLSISTVANLDAANSVWLSSDAGGGAGAVELTAGSTISWDRLRALYAYVNASTSVNILVLDEGGVFNNGVAVANALNASGLAAAIAAQINLAGVPSIDIPAVLYSGSISDTLLIPSIDISRYQSVTVACYSFNQSRVVRILTTGGGIGLSEYTVPVLPGTSVTNIIPAYGDSLSVRLATVTNPGVTATVIITGSYRAVPRPTTETITLASTLAYSPTAIPVLSNGLVTDTPGLFTYNATTPANFDVTYSPRFSIKGRARMTAQINAASGSFGIAISDRVSGTWLYPFAIATGGGASTILIDTFIIPSGPWDVRIYCNAVTGGPVKLSIVTEQ